MKKIILPIVTIVLLLVGCTSFTNKESTFDKLMDQFYEEYLQLYPFSATMAGDNRYNDLFPNSASAEYRDKVLNFYEKYKRNIEVIDRSTLSEKDKVNYDVLQWECDIAIEGSKLKDYLIPLDQFNGQHLMVAQMASGKSIQPFNSVKDYDNWLSRLDGYLIWCDSAMGNMKKGIEQKYTLPKILAEKVAEQFESLSKGPAEKHLFYTPIINMPDSFPDEAKTRLTAAYKSIIEDKIIPKHKAFEEFLLADYIPACRTSSGISDLPEGDVLYAHYIKYYTNTTMTADEIFKLGKKEVSRITLEMEKVKGQVGYEGDLKSFFEDLRTKKELMPYTEPEQVIAHFNEIHERMMPGIHKLFNKVPKTPFEVRRTEAFREKTASAEYNPGSIDGTRPGIFYVPIPDVKNYNILSDEDLFLHEAIPGHHFQISLQQEDTTLPNFRKLLWYSGYGEGWALYTESLGKELGLYTDPYQYFGMLSAEMHRAIRLVVDAGMHAKGWTREQAIQYSLDHEAEPEANVVAEIERYMAFAGQALSYKIGQLKIRELRTKAEKELGDDFDIAQFHNKVLETGCVPLNIFEKHMLDWIESEKNKE